MTNYHDSDYYSLLFLCMLGRRYQIQFYSTAHAMQKIIHENYRKLNCKIQLWFIENFGDRAVNKKCARNAYCIYFQDCSVTQSFKYIHEIFRCGYFTPPSIAKLSPLNIFILHRTINDSAHCKHKHGKTLC